MPKEFSDDDISQLLLGIIVGMGKDTTNGETIEQFGLSIEQFEGIAMATAHAITDKEDFDGLPDLVMTSMMIAMVLGRKIALDSLTIAEKEMKL